MSPVTWFILFSIGLFYSTYGKFGYINTTQTSDNGITLNNINALISAGQWLLFSSEGGFELSLRTDSTFAFSSTKISTLKLEIGSNDIATGDDELIVSFSQSSSKHITTVIELGATRDHTIYPQCDPAAPYSISMAYANVYNDVSNRQTLTPRAQAAANNNLSNYGNFDPITDPPTIEFPLTFTLENHPIDNYTIFTYSNPGASARSCGYTNISPDVPMDIYIATEILESFDLSYFNVSYYEEEPTSSPTQNPTYPPTIPSPSISPSDQPSSSPTQEPTISDPFCEWSGIKHADLEICCALSCGVCEEIGCSGNLLCCASDIRDAGNSCDTNIAPCVVTSTQEPSKSPTNNPTATPTEITIIDTFDVTVDIIIEGDGINDGLSELPAIDEYGVLFMIEGIIAFFIILAMLDCIHSKTGMNCGCFGFHQHDHWNYRVIIETSLRISDIASNLAVLYIMITYYFIMSTDLILFISLICNIFSITMAYLLNLISMCKIVKLPTNSRGPMIWFDQHMIFFVFCVIITCDSYLSVQIISSNMFGLDLFNSGHSKIELKKIRFLKIILLIVQV